jgi:hypothetical protein
VLPRPSRLQGQEGRGKRQQEARQQGRVLAAACSTPAASLDRLRFGPRQATVGGCPCESEGKQHTPVSSMISCKMQCNQVSTWAGYRQGSSGSTSYLATDSPYCPRRLEKPCHCSMLLSGTLRGTPGNTCGGKKQQATEVRYAHSGGLASRHPTLAALPPGSGAAWQNCLAG